MSNNGEEEVERSDSDGYILLQAYIGLIGLIINIILLWLSVGYWRTKRHKVRISTKAKIIKFLSIMSVIWGILFCISQTFFMQNVFTNYSISDIQCKIFWRFAYLCWTFQRYFIYIFCVLRLKFLFTESKLMHINAKIYNRFVIGITVLQLAVTLSWCINYTVTPNTATEYTQCDGDLEPGQNGYRIISNGLIILVDFIVGIVTTIYFAIKLCAVAKSSQAETVDVQLRRIAKRVLVSGILAISSTLLFFILLTAIQGLGRLLPIDSAINGLAVLVSLDFKCNKESMREYLCFGMSIRSPSIDEIKLEEELSNAETRNMDDDNIERMKKQRNNNNLKINVDDNEQQDSNDSKEFQSVQSQSNVTSTTTVGTNTSNGAAHDYSSKYGDASRSNVIELQNKNGSIQVAILH